MRQTDGLSNFLGKKHSCIFGHLSTLLYETEKKYESNKEESAVKNFLIRTILLRVNKLSRQFKLNTFTLLH